MEHKKSVCNKTHFQKLYDTYSDAIHNFIYYKSGNVGFSEDTVQESFLRLWNKCADVPFEKAKSFLYKVASNLFLDKVKHQKVQLKFLSRQRSKVSNETPAYLMEEQEFKQKLETVIGTIPEQIRAVFLMNRIEKMKYREIAEALSVSQKTVEKRMHKALIIIREKLGDFKI